ncbi:related to RGD2 - GTPase activating protein [Cephalotrichum gorgonifer]|uniref:Related to RGD2 - GTPase activating protein n=1 Tax=Cephalotrichum gorgonifer TaxID=2041049 RepID=A0AAE8STN0_9PEZI|nr:related to RGD2 - GTPase activating protein [Cephalotrichum gorgonifer]
MPGFTDSFWSTDYAAGLGVLFGKLQQGVLENRQVLTIARMRAEADEIYGQRLSDIAPTVDKITGGFSNDDGASVRKAYDGVRGNMDDASKSHKKIAQNIRDLVVNPFSRWCDAHESRIQESQDELQARIKAHDRQAEVVKKLRSNYLNKCRVLEDIEEENKLAFPDPETSPKANVPGVKVPEIKVVENQETNDELEETVYEIGDEIYTEEQLQKILAHMLTTIKLGETKVPILGTYQNVSAGTDIVEYLQRHMGTSSVSYAERIGQDLVTNGFLRLVGNVGNTFANSSKMSYQWRPKSFTIAGVPEKKAPARTFSMPASSEGSDSPVVGAVSEYLSNWNVLNNQHPNETQSQKLAREAKESDERYRAAVQKLDEMRCDLEETIFLHLKFLERCELDRLKAIKTVLLDFSGTVSNVIPSLQSSVDTMMLFQEAVQPASDLRYLIETYRTGSFIPKVTVYSNYYNRVDEQTFGIDLEARASSDRKRVPTIVTTILTYLDNHYPDLEDDAAMRGVWLADVPLTRTHKLRSRLNDGKPPSPEAFDGFDVATVASLLKLYLLELPDSLISSHVYEIIRTIYSNTAPETGDGARIAVLQQTLSQLRLTNIATLDACMNHFTRLIDLTSADEAFVSALANNLASCILRPKTETSLTLEERHAYRLVRDLFAHKDAIFNELKRMSTPGYTGSLGRSGTRPRAISTDESTRKAHMEERNRLLIEKTPGSSRGRASSPAPSPRGGHRRDRSVGGPETRFPIAKPTGASDRHRSSLGSLAGGGKRQSLEVPLGDGPAAAPASEPVEPANGEPNADSDSQQSSPVEKRLSLQQSSPVEKRLSSPVEKRDSLSRSGARFSSGRRLPLNLSMDAGRESPKSAIPPRGVTLEDRPME